MAQKILIADYDQIVHESLGIYLKAEGFETQIILKGLGEIDAIAEMFVEHLRQAKSV